MLHPAPSRCPVAGSNRRASSRHRVVAPRAARRRSPRPSPARPCTATLPTAPHPGGAASDRSVSPAPTIPTMTKLNMSSHVVTGTAPYRATSGRGIKVTPTQQIAAPSVRRSPSSVAVPVGSGVPTMSTTPRKPSAAPRSPAARGRSRSTSQEIGNAQSGLVLRNSALCVDVVCRIPTRNTI